MPSHRQICHWLAVKRSCPYAGLEAEERRTLAVEPPYDDKVIGEKPDRVLARPSGDRTKETDVHKEIGEEVQKGVPIPFEEAIALEGIRRAIIKAKSFATQQGVQKAVTRAFPPRPFAPAHPGPGQGAPSGMGRHVDTSQIGKAFSRHKKLSWSLQNAFSDDPRKP